MTHPSTENADATYGDVPAYPTSQMMPREYWRKQNSRGPGGADPGQYVTVDKGDGQVHKKPVQPGWNHAVYVGPSEDDPND